MALTNRTVPCILLRRTRLVSRRFPAPLWCLHRRNPHGRSLHRLQLCYKLHPRIPQARQSNSRGASPAHDYWSYCSSCWSLLVRLDEQPKHHMGAAGSFCRSTGIRLYGPVLAGHELPHRLLWVLLQ